MPIHLQLTPPIRSLQLINDIEFVAPKNEGTTTTEELIFRSTISCFIIQSQLPPREQLLFLNKVNPKLPKNHQAQLQLMICIFFVSINQQKWKKNNPHKNFYGKIIIFSLSNFDAGTGFGMSIDMVAQVVGMATVLGLWMSS